MINENSSTEMPNLTYPMLPSTTGYQSIMNPLDSNEINSLKERIDKLESEKNEFESRLKHTELKCEQYEKDSEYFEISLKSIEEKLR